MKLSSKLLFGGLLTLATTLGVSTEAFAWYCHAQARDGTYGYSYNYPNKRGAMNRALRECQARTYRRCYIVVCRRNG